MPELYDNDLPLWRLPAPTDDAEIDVGRLLAFVDQLYHPVVGRNFYDQLYFCVALVFIILLLAGSVIGHRVFTGRAWFVKRTHVSSGTFFIPNSVMTFLACQGVFVALWIVYSLISIRYYENKGFQKNYLLWRVLVWVPLWDGGWWTGFGIFSAFPDALKSKRGSMEKQHRSVFSPFVFNVACWVTPVVQVASLLPPAIYAARHYNATLDDFEKWRATKGDLDFPQMSPQDVDVIRSQVIEFWQQVTRSYWYYGIAMTCWIAWALICFAVYVPVGAHTLRRIRKQLKEARSKHNSNYCAAVGVHFRESPHTVVVTVQNPSAEDKQSTSTAESQSPRHHPDTCDTVPQKRAITQHLLASLASAAARLQPRRAVQKDSSMTIEQRRIRNLRRVYRNLSVQYYGISVAIGCFLISAILQAVDGYVSARQNDIEVPQVVGNLLAGWVTVLFSFLTVFCIFWRSFDPSLNIDMEDEPCPPIITRAKLTALSRRLLRVVVPKLRKSTTVESGSDEPSHDDVIVAPHCEHLSNACHTYAGPGDNSLQLPKATLPGRGSNSLPEYPSLYYVTPFGKVPAVGARLPDAKPDRSKSLPHKTPPSAKSRGAIDVRRPLPCCSLLAEHGSAYKPAASSFGQWRETHSSPPSTPPARSSAPLLSPFSTSRDDELSL